MSQLLLESIRIDHGKTPLLPYHQARMNASVQALYGVKNTISLQNTIQRVVKHHLKGVYKCRIVYERQIKSITITPYQIKPIKSLKLVDGDGLTYDLKYENRQKINQLFEQRGEFDDILILKNGYLTDTSYCNVFLFDGHEWWTPNTCLLKGTRRSFLLKNGQVRERSIHQKDLHNYKKIRLCNAMIPWADGVGFDLFF